MDSTLARHDALIASAVDAHGGVLLKHKGEGDSTFSVFASAIAAAAAATEAQRVLAAEQWDDATPISVRMGIHTGEAFQHGPRLLRADGQPGRTTCGRSRRAAKCCYAASAALVERDCPTAPNCSSCAASCCEAPTKVEAIHELVDHQRPRVASRGTGDMPPAVPSLPVPLASSLPSVFVGRRDLTETIHARDRAAAARSRPCSSEASPARASRASRRRSPASRTATTGRCCSGRATSWSPLRTSRSDRRWISTSAARRCRCWPTTSRGTAARSGA